MLSLVMGLGVSCVGVWVLYRLFCIFTNFYILDLHNRTCVAFAKLERSINKHRIHNRTSHDSVMIVKSVRLLNLQLNTWGFPKLCLLSSVEYVIPFKDVVQSLLNICLYDANSSILIEPRTNHKGPLKKQPMNTCTP